MPGRIIKGREVTSFSEVTPIGCLLLKFLQQHGDKICQIDADLDKSETFASVKQRSIRLALALQQKHLSPADVVFICGSNDLDTCIVYLAALFLAAKVANTDPAQTSKTTSHLITLVKPKIIFVVDSAVGMIEESLRNLEVASEIIVIGQSDKYQCLKDLTVPQLGEEIFRPVDHDVDDVAMIFFSSGSTSLPKAICHSHRTLSYFLHPQSLSAKFNLKNVTSVLHFTSFYGMTSTGLMFFLPILEGCIRIFSANTSGEFVLNLIEKYKISAAYMVPNYTYKLTNVENFKRFDTSSLKMLLTGGTSLNPDQYHRLIDMFQNAKIQFGYGMTEIGVIATFDIKSDTLMAQKMGSVGKVASATQVKVVDIHTGELLGSNQQGEICAKSPRLMVGYYHADASSCFDSDGFLKTGDLGYFDEDDYLYVIERFKETFKYLCHPIMPTIIESALMEHPMIAEAVVFGIPRDEEGEVPTACVTLKQGFCATVSDIDRFVTERVSDREKLRGGIFIVETLPKLATGKINRHKIREDVQKRVAK